ncbi:PepSY domain-containing protein [Streptomyces sp. DSM 41972]|uniref:PepSY domain-containing protein n=1 Tax=Streptomyces althioticus subsp. attaecolombicae TaxID=3075534 RepID=A0ABU3I023_9ACTN|nr:PepSY domain-containing protein [Streptomyces sp. DSM 41972]SCD57526.1 Peptidase propeptide and YPEB domain-containing protein [Streptomyces sp. di50b]SCE21486.1 Peptidase propeptide and YPEB domain-containing protein [Streptomyces sp. di188]
MKRNIVIAVVTAAALVGGGTATALAVAGDDDDTTSVTRTDDDRDDRGEDRSDDRGDDRDDRGQDRSDDPDDDGDDGPARAAAPGGVTAAEAIAAALDHTPGTAVSVELDDGSWEIDVLGKGDTWHSVRIAPDTGKVLGAQQDDEDDAAEVRAALKNASVTAEDAAKAAASKGTVVAVELDDDDTGWDAETRASGGDERDWKIDLRSAAVTADRDDD